MTGDPAQINNPYVDSSTNGLVYTPTAWDTNLMWPWFT